MPEQPYEHRILVIDDEVFVRELLEEYFDKLDYEVMTVDSGDAGIEAVHASGFGVVLVDLKMPGKDGIETLCEIRRIDPLCLIVIMTGYPTIDSSIEALRAGRRGDAVHALRERSPAPDGPAGLQLPRHDGPSLHNNHADALDVQLHRPGSEARGTLRFGRE